MILSSQGLAHLERQEALVLIPYRDEGGLWTVGYGHLLKPNEPRRPITKAEAIAYLKQDVALAEACVNAQHLKLTQYQFDALVCLVFNIGVGAFKKSTLLTDLKAGHLPAAAAEFPKWNKVNGQPSAVLTNRRKIERAMFETGMYHVNAHF